MFYFGRVLQSDLDCLQLCMQDDGVGWLQHVTDSDCS